MGTSAMSVRSDRCILKRVWYLQSCFDSAIRRYEYEGAYRGVFPVKCNHDRELIKAILEAGRPHGFGLEVC